MGNFPVFSALSLVHSARALSGPGTCPDVKTAGGNTYSQPWETERHPSTLELFDWYDEAELLIRRVEDDPRVDQTQVAVLRKRWDEAPNRYQAAMLDTLSIAQLMRELAQKALCLFHDANHGTSTAPGVRLPAPVPSEGRPVDEWVHEQRRKMEGWLLIGGAAAVLYWLATRDNR